MCKKSLNAVFYSKDNYDLAYTIKKALWGYEISLVNISSFAELAYSIHQDGVNILFVDANTVNLNSELVELTLGSKLGVPDNVIFIGDTKNVELFINNQNRFKFENDNFSEQLIEISPKIKFNIKSCRGKKFDMSTINTYLTQYLMQLGFHPKYAGFNYIKHCIEEALANNGVLGSLSTDIYPVVARRNKTTQQNVERNIRNCIESAYKCTQGKDKTLCDMLKQTRISNRALLSFLLDQILISHEQLEKANTAF